MKRIYFTVTNDLNYDQRMQRICTSLAQNNYHVTLIGRRLKTSLPLEKRLFNQYSIRCWFNKGKLFYAEYNMRLFFYLLFKKMDCICAIDLDTILPCLFISRLKKIPRVYDAHELFTEMKEVVTRPVIYKFWKRIEQYAVPKFLHGYTVNHSIAEKFKSIYNSNYQVIRNLPVLQVSEQKNSNDKFIIYQGAVNEGRSFETLIPAMKNVVLPLFIYGEGNFMLQAEELIKKNNLQQKVFLKGSLPPAELKLITPAAWLGITLFENNGLSNYFSLANRFFDYMHAGIPQLCVNYPEYRKINKQYNTAILIDDLSPQAIAEAINNVLNNDQLYRQLKSNCIIARQELNWHQEEKKLIAFYNSILNQQ